jgi:hypothetical protein
MADDRDLPPPPPTGADAPPPPPKPRSALQDLLDRTRQETESETQRLMDGMRAKEDDERRKAEEDENRKASEARARVEEERRKREESLKEFEARKRREAEAIRQASEVRQEISVAQKAPPPKSQAPLFGGIAVAMVAAGVAAFLLIPRGEPAVLALDKPLDVARPGAVVATPVPFGAKAMEQLSSPPEPGKVVAILQPGLYKAPAPEPKRVAAPVKAKPILDITTGILGGKKIVK